MRGRWVRGEEWGWGEGEEVGEEEWGWDEREVGEGRGVGVG